MLLQALRIISYPLVNSNWSYSPETPNLGQILWFLEPCDLEIWRMTLKNNRAPLLSKIKLYASFHHHMRIQTGVTVRKRLSWVVTSVTLTFDLWPWPFAWTLLLSLVITPENFMMIRWGEHSQKGVTDGRTDGQTDRRTENTICRAAWSQLKTILLLQHHYLRKFPKASMFSSAALESSVHTGWRWLYSVRARSRFRWKLHPSNQAWPLLCTSIDCQMSEFIVA